MKTEKKGSNYQYFLLFTKTNMDKILYEKTEYRLAVLQSYLSFPHWSAISEDTWNSSFFLSSTNKKCCLTISSFLLRRGLLPNVELYFPDSNQRYPIHSYKKISQFTQLEHKKEIDFWIEYTHFRQWLEINKIEPFVGSLFKIHFLKLRNIEALYVN